MHWQSYNIPTPPIVHIMRTHTLRCDKHKKKPRTTLHEWFSYGSPRNSTMRRTAWGEKNLAFLLW